MMQLTRLTGWTPDEIRSLSPLEFKSLVKILENEKRQRDKQRI